MNFLKKRIKENRFSRLLIGLNNWRVRRQRQFINPEHVLLLLPRCLQSSECAQNIATDINNCQRCGKCKIKFILDLCDEFGVVPFVATGGRIAVKKVLETWVEAVIAIACETELQQGIKASPKKVLAIRNLRPHGPCFNTDLDLEELKQAIRELTLTSPKTGRIKPTPGMCL